MNKRVPFLLSLLALAILAASIAYWALQLVQPQQRPLAAVAPSNPQPPSIDAAATLFGGELAAQSSFTLTGVVAAGSASAAILVAEGEPPKAVRVGREVAPGVVVAEVHPRYVMLRDGGVLKRVDLAPDTRPPSTAGEDIAHARLGSMPQPQQYEQQPLPMAPPPQPQTQPQPQPQPQPEQQMQQPPPVDPTQQPVLPPEPVDDGAPPEAQPQVRP